MHHPQSLCVFCGSAMGLDEVYKQAAEELGVRLAQAGIKLVFGGGHIGLMGVVADATLANGGTVTGVIPESLQQRELAHDRLSELHVVDSMHTRKALMADLAEAFVALPGGLGTFEELCEILTWGQLRFHNKPIAILNINGYYDTLLELFDHAVGQGFMKPENRELLNVSNSIDELMEWLLNCHSGAGDHDALYDLT